MRAIRLTFILFALVISSGCVSYERHAEARRQRLLSLYPPGISTRADVQARWGRINPEISELRPAGGWAECRLPFVRERCATSERRTGKQVERCDLYWGPDGLVSLCYCWFYYDQSDRLLDVDW